MKKWLLVIMMMWVLAHGDVTEDVIFEGHTNVRTKAGILKGWLEQGAVFPNRINGYDLKGQRRSFLQKDPVFPGRWQFRDR
jgi:hypothetical protein